MSEASKNPSSTATKSAVMYSFALIMPKPLTERNAHNQLYDMLKTLKSDWYQAKDDENRRILFVQHSNALLCRSSNKPQGVAFKKEVKEVTTGDRIKISVRLPAMRRFRQKGITRLIPIELEDRDDYYSGILSRNGVEVDSIEWLPNPDSTIFFKSGKTMVTVPVDDVSAWVSVKDAEMFVEAILRGVGRYKTYGCGMISIIKKKA